VSVSLLDVAKRAGVSAGTVSQALNGNKAARISAATEERIRQIASEMGYRPNSYARIIARRKTSTIRLVTCSHRNPYYVMVAAAVDVRARQAGYKLWVDATLDERLAYGPGDAVDIWPVDGALFYGDTQQDLEEFLGGQAGEIPVVYMGYQGDDDVDAVTSDIHAGGRLAVEHLVERGYRRIAYLSPEAVSAWIHTDQRVQAYEDVCREAGLPIEHILFPGPLFGSEKLLSLEAGIAIASRPAAERPDAIVCRNDNIALGLLHGLRRAGLSVPEDVAITGFDGGESALCLDRPQTTVAIPVDAMSEAAVELLVRRMKGDRETPPQRIVLPTELVVGATT
jgi:LacI family repressor for deo operon, udp, cdd, tsx, nupC, and nupG